MMSTPMDKSDDDSQFFPMKSSQRLSLFLLSAFAAFAFLPSWRTVSWNGMVVFGWLMAALMIASPALALLVFYREKQVARSRRDG